MSARIVATLRPGALLTIRIRPDGRVWLEPTFPRRAPVCEPHPCRSLETALAEVEGWAYDAQLVDERPAPGAVASRPATLALDL